MPLLGMRAQDKGSVVVMHGGRNKREKIQVVTLTGFIFTFMNKINIWIILSISNSISKLTVGTVYS
jgi:hypothetical protein